MLYKVGNNDLHCISIKFPMKKILSFYFLSLFLNPGAFCQFAKDSVAIVKLLEKESLTWRSGDIKGHAECWAMKPYSRILVSTSEGSVYDVAPAIMLNPGTDMVGNGGTSVNSNYKMSIHGTDAWVSYDEVSTNKEDKKTYSYEMKILEKIEGEWKLVGQSIHIYKP